MECFETTWKDVQAGRVLLGTDRNDLEGVVSCPFGWAAKYEADRTVAPVGRVFHDLRDPINVHSHKLLHPRVGTPTIRAAALRIITLKVLFPLLRVKLTKRDIDAAFKRILLALFDIDGTLIRSGGGVCNWGVRIAESRFARQRPLSVII